MIEVEEAQEEDLEEEEVTVEAEEDLTEVVEEAEVAQEEEDEVVVLEAHQRQ